MQICKEYLKEVRMQYLKTKLKKEKGALLSEACKRSGLDRKYVIRQFKAKSRLDVMPSERKKKRCIYDGSVCAALVRVWKIFDYPCGDRLVPILQREVFRLRNLRELVCSDEVAKKLMQIKSTRIDELVSHEREVLKLSRNRNPKTHPSLYGKIPVRISSEWVNPQLGECQIDFVAHCGNKLIGEFIHSLSATDVQTGWYQGYAHIGRAQARVHNALGHIQKCLPFPIKEIHSDNDSAVINDLIFKFTQIEEISFTRSRPYKKNDNAYIESRNWTHVRKIFGYERYDTEEALEIFIDLHTNELPLYKNFFQPVMRLKSKERINGRIKRAYDIPKTPYERLMQSKEISQTKKRQLTKRYNSLNPAQLKRNIDAKLKKLHALKNQHIPKSQKETKSKTEQETATQFQRILSEKVIKPMVTNYAG